MVLTLIPCPPCEFVLIDAIDLVSDAANVVVSVSFAYVGEVVDGDRLVLADADCAE